MVCEDTDVRRCALGEAFPERLMPMASLIGQVQHHDNECIVIACGSTTVLSAIDKDITPGMRY